MATREKGRKRTKQEAPQEASQQYKVTDPISMADLEHMHTRRGKYPSRPPPFGPKTWELARKEKEEKVLKERRERPLSTPLGTTSTDAMDTEDAQEFSKEIAEKVIEKELKKQKYEQYQQAKQTSNYQVPKSIIIPVPDLNKPRQEKVSRPTSVLSNFDMPLYEELGEPRERQPIKRSMSVTPGLSGMKSGEGARPKGSSNRMSAFQDYTSKMMSALNNPWKPQSRKTAMPIQMAVPPLVYVSAAGTPASDNQTKDETSEKYVPMNFSAVDKTVLTPQGRQEMEGVASPIKFTDTLQNGDALKVNPQGGALMEALGFGLSKVEEDDPDFYMPDGQGKKLSETYQMFTNEQTPEGNPGVIVKLTNLVKKYRTPFYLMDKKSGYLYVLHEKGYKQIEEKGLLYPSESMIIAGALDENRGNPFVTTQSSRLPETPAAESTRVPLKTSTDKREVKEKKEPLTPDGLLEKEQTEWYQKELKEAEEDMVHAYLEKSKLEHEEIEMIKQRALKAQEEFELLERKQNENKEIHEKMKEEIKKMDQAVADSSSFIQKMKNKDPQQIVYEKIISDFWDTSDVPQGSLLVKIASYPSLESLNEEPKDELTEVDYEYYDRKRKILIEKMAIANDVYLAHLQNYDQRDSKDKSQKFLFQYNEVGNELNRQFDIVAERLRLPLEQPLLTYPSLGNLMDAIQQEDMGDKNREYFQEMSKEVKIKNDIAQKVLDNRLSVIKTPAEKEKMNLQYQAYQKESKKLLDFCKKMMGKREKEIDSLELEQPEGVPEVKEISKEKLNEKIKEIIDQPQYVKPIGENTLPPHYSREISRYEPPNPIKQKERKDLIKKVKEMTSEESKGGKREKSVEVDTDLSWDHEGLKPLPKAPKNKITESPKPPRTPRVPKAKVNTEETLKKGQPVSNGDSKEGKRPEVSHEENKDRKEASLEKRPDPDIRKKNGKNDKEWNFKSPENTVDRKTAKWIEEQNEFLGKQKEKEFEKDKKERDPPVFNPNGPVKVLQRSRATHHTGYEQPPQHLMSARRDQAPHPSMIVTNRGDGNWRNQGKRYPLKERHKPQGGGYGQQYGTGGERRNYQAYRTDQTQQQSYNAAYRSQRQSSYDPTKSTGNEQGGNGGGEDRNDKKKYKNTRVNYENDSHEDSETEDSYEFEITAQQLSQVTPGGGALKIKLAKKKPLKITAGAPDGQSETIPMELERNWGSKRIAPSTYVDTTSESTLPTRRSGAPLFITSIHPKDNEGPQTGTSSKRVNDLKGSTNYGLTKERVTQVQGSNTRESQKPVRDRDPPGNGGGGDSSGGTSGDQRFPGEGRGPSGRNGNQGGGGGDDDHDPSDDGDDDFSSTDSSAPRKRKHKSTKYVYVLQGPPGPKGQEGQPGQAGRDGRDGQNLSLTRELEETLRAHRPNLDTTGLENSFDQFGQTIFEVLNAQHRTNQKLEEQFRRANETQEYQAEAMQDMAQANFQMKYDHMFAGVPMYDGTDPDTFDDWLYQIESLCELSRRDVWVELMG